MPPQHYAPTEVWNVNLEMTENRLLVKPADEPDKTKGGIVLPNRGKPTRGVIVAVGPGRVSQEGTKIPMPFAVGQEVIYGSFSGTEIEVDGVEHLILKEPDIYAVVTPKPEAEHVEVKPKERPAEPETRTPGRILLAEKRTDLVLP